MENLKKLRYSSHLTQDELSKKLNMPQATYNSYEIGRSSPTVEPLIKIADFYNVSIDYLVGRKFGNDFGFLTKEQVSTIKLFLTLNDFNQARVSGYITSLVENQ